MMAALTATSRRTQDKRLKAVRNAVLLMNRIGKNSVAVRDADKGPDVANGIFSFPGTKPPEKRCMKSSMLRNTSTLCSTSISIT